MRPEPIPPNSPRETGVGVVRPRAAKPDHVSKSKERQAMWRGTMDTPRGAAGAAGPFCARRCRAARRALAALPPRASGTMRAFDPTGGRRTPPAPDIVAAIRRWMSHRWGFPFPPVRDAGAPA
jgi:hypothetical protein